MKRTVITLFSLAVAATVAAAPIRALLFTSEEDCSKALLWLHANGRGDISLFTNAFPEFTNFAARAGIAGYSADRWNSATNCKHATSNFWAVPMNDRRIDAMLARRPDLTNEFRLIFPTNNFQIIDSSFWDRPEE